MTKIWIIDYEKFGRGLFFYINDQNQSNLLTDKQMGDDIEGTFLRVNMYSVACYKS